MLRKNRRAGVPFSVVFAISIVVAGCGADADPDDGRKPGRTNGKSDSTSMGMEEVYCKDLSCPEGTHCTAYMDYCWEEDCPKVVVECAWDSDSDSDSCHCDTLCSLPEYNDCCAGCSIASDGAGEDSGGGYGSDALQPCYGVCWYGAKCTDYCPPSASCQQVIDDNESYWQVFGCGS